MPLLSLAAVLLVRLPAGRPQRCEHTNWGEVSAGRRPKMEGVQARGRGSDLGRNFELAYSTHLLAAGREELVRHLRPRRRHGEGRR